MRRRRRARRSRRSVGTRLAERRQSLAAPLGTRCDRAPRMRPRPRSTATTTARDRSKAGRHRSSSSSGVHRSTGASRRAAPRSASGTGTSASSIDGPRSSSVSSAGAAWRRRRAAVDASTTQRNEAYDSEQLGQRASCRRPTARRSRRAASRRRAARRVGCCSSSSRFAPIRATASRSRRRSSSRSAASRQSRYSGCGRVGRPGSSSGRACKLARAGAPRCRRPELLEHSVDEPHELGVLVGDGDAVVRRRRVRGSIRSRTSIVGSCATIPYEERVVTEVGVDLALLQGDAGTRCARRPRCSSASGTCVVQDADRRRAAVTQTVRPARSRDVVDRRVVPHQELLVGGVVLGAERDVLPAAADHRDGADRQVDLAVARRTSTFSSVTTGTRSTTAGVYVVAEDALGDLVGEVDLEALDVARDRVAGGEAQRVLVDADAQPSALAGSRP